MLSAGGRANAMSYRPMMAMTGMKDGGDLRTGQGGHVPGSGSGDKVPAKYEPGEFVVSNDKLDSAPGLREQLHDLRGNVLASKGVSVEEADAKALGYHGRSTRSQDGRQQGESQPHIPAQVDAPLGGENLLRSPDGVPGAQGAGRGGLTLRAAQGFGGSADPAFWGGNPDPLRGSQANQSLLDAARQRIDPVQSAARSAAPAPTPSTAPQAQTIRAGYTPPPVNPDTGRYLSDEAQTRQRPVVEGRASGVPGTGGNQGIRAAGDLAKSKGLWASAKGSANTVAQAAKSVASGSFLNADLAGGAAKALRGGAGIVKGIASSPFSSAGLAGAGIGGGVRGYSTPTEQYRQRAGMDAQGGLGGDLLARSVGVLADVGDAATLGHATKLGNFLAGNGYNANGADGTAPANTPQVSSQAAPGAQYTQPGGDATMPGQDPGRPSLRNPNEIKVERQANGTLSFSGGKGIGQDGGDISYTGEWAGKKGGGDRVSTLPGMSKDEIDRTLTNPDGSRWSANDNAVMAANLRDGINPYAGTSRGQAERGDELQNQLRQLALSPAGTPGRKGALRQLTAMETRPSAGRTSLSAATCSPTKRPCARTRRRMRALASKPSRTR